VTDWDRLVREHGETVFAAAWRVLGHAADTEDVVQEVFFEAHRLWGGRKVRNWSGLLRRLATCRAVDRLRRRKFAVPVDGLNLIGSDPGPEAMAMEHELAHRLREAVAQLPEREASVFCLRYFDELPYQEIADSLGITTGAVAAALHKARARLEALLTGVPQGE
jgi:RNA polymerase sigma-70 factor (ECF subfamily)